MHTHIEQIQYTSNFNESARLIKKNNIYTYVGFNNLGLPYKETFKLLNLRYQDSQADGTPEAYRLTVNDIGKYKKTIYLHHNKQFLLFDCAVLVNTDAVVHVSIEDFDCGHAKVYKRWPSYDARYLIRAMHSTTVKPFIYHYSNDLNPEMLITSHVIS